jgi:hypothetical protein
MPVEQRSTQVQTTTIIISVVALAVVLLLGFLVLRSAGDGAGVTLQLGEDVFAAGDSTKLAEAIEADGPALFSDVSGRGQQRPIYLNHLGGVYKEGWIAFDAKPPGGADTCFLEWDSEAEMFAGVDDCVPETYPADGAGLQFYVVTVTDDGGVEIDLGRSEIEPDG